MGRDSYHLGIDIGGTFTDITFFDRSGGNVGMEKHPTSPNPADTVKDAVSQLSEEGRFDLRDCGLFTHATTIASNTLIERQGRQVGFLTTDGFRDVVEMRDESRYDLYDVHISFPEPIPQRRFRTGITERVAEDGAVLDPVDRDELVREVRALRDQGADSIAVSFLNSFANDVNEQTAKSVIQDEFPDLSVSVSSEVAPQLGEFPRGVTTSINAYLQPIVDEYITEIQKFLTDSGFTGSFLIMTSGGGVVPSASARDYPVRLIESGPTAGALVAEHLGKKQGNPDVISFDMGGTTSKGCIIENYEVNKSYEFEAARENQFKSGSGYPLLIPNVDLIEFSSGGGSIASIDKLDSLQIGPESAGSVPGPACYDRGGEQATITDADAMLGYLREETFEGSPINLNIDRAREAITTEIAEPLGIGGIEAATGILRAANQNISNAFKEHAAERGVDVRQSRMLAFGGAGPMHAEAIAKSMDIDTVVVPPKAGVLSSFGLLVTPKSVTITEDIREEVSEIRIDELEDRFEQLASEALSVLDVDADRASSTERQYKFDMRHVGQGFDEEVVFTEGMPATVSSIQDAFKSQYKDLYGVLPDKEVVISQIKLELTMSADASDVELAGPAHSAPDASPVIETREAYFPYAESFHQTQFLDRAMLNTGQTITTPCVIEGNGTTTVIGPDSDAQVDENRNIIIRC
jgi:N-methylhydantoinase A/oxoprolinase/acetone carboxylase beta subunit